MRPRWTRRTKLAVVLLLAACGCAPRLVWSGHDPGRELHAQVFAGGDQEWVRAGGEEGRHYDRVATEAIVFSREGARVAYAALDHGRWWMVVGTLRLGPWDGVAEPRFSPDGRRLAFLAQTGDGWQVVVDGTAGARFEAIQGRTLQFSADGAHVAYVANEGVCSRIVVDGDPGECRERIRALRVTGAGTVASVVREGAQERFLLGRTLGPPVDAIGDWTVTDDGRRVAYAARTGTRWTAVVDGVGSPDCDRVHSLVFGDRGRRVAWVCRRDNRSAVVIDGVQGEPHPLVSSPVLAAQAPDHAYVARDGRGAWVRTGSALLGPYAEVAALRVASGGGMAFLARLGGQTRVVHAGEETLLSAPVEESLVLSEDGRHWAVIDGDPRVRQLWLTIDGRRVRRVTADEVFAGTRGGLAPWLSRQLRAACQRDASGGGI